MDDDTKNSASTRSHHSLAELMRGVITPFLILGFDADSPLKSGEIVDLAAVRKLEIGRGNTNTYRLPASEHQHAVLSRQDSFMSTHHTQLVRSPQGWFVNDLNSKNGTFVNGARIREARVVDGDMLMIGHTVFWFRDQVPFPADNPMRRMPGMKTFHPGLCDVFGRLANVAQAQTPVLIRGETGTGKELTARAVHMMSEVSGPFVGVNCGALPKDLAAGELFGWKTGAFSGANRDHVGFVQTARNGTLFLDEIGDLPLDAQAMLLRTLQEREVVPLGSAKATRVNFRLVSATHQNLESLVSKRLFRKDLLSRIEGFTVRMPALRERKEDLGLIIATIIRRHAERVAKDVMFRTEAVSAILAHDWPMNIRELDQALSGALAQTTRIAVTDLPPAVQRATEPRRARLGDPHAGARGPRELTEEDLATRAELVALLRKTMGNISHVAEAMGKERIQIRRWIKRYEIRLEEYE